MIPDLYERKLGFGEILRASWEIFVQNFKYLFVFGFILSVIFRILDYSVFTALPPITDDKRLTTELKSLFTRSFGFVSWIVAIVIVEQVSAGRQVGWCQIMVQIKKFFWSGFLVDILLRVVSSSLWLPKILVRLIGGGKALGIFLQFSASLIVISLMIYFCFVFQALILRDTTGLTAFTYSFQTVRGRWWKIFGTIILVSLIFFVPVVILAKMLGRFIPLTAIDRMYWLAPVTGFFGILTPIFITIIFLNIDSEASRNGQRTLLKVPTQHW